MKRVFVLAIVLCFGLTLAEEGMWRPKQLPGMKSALKAAGLELDPESMTQLTEHPMNAVIDLAGCSASFVSPKGLVITNHHCSWGSLQYNSTEENNLLDNGFLAESFEKELPAAPGSRVRVTVEVSDVTEIVVGGLDPSLDGEQRYQAIETSQKKLVAACEEDPGHRCRVRSFYGGLEYQLIKQLEIQDVRLVYAPPRAIGVYGGDIDNWMWPRHTGDYSFIRAYVAPDGAPAVYAEDNVPFEPKHWLKISPEGIQEDDYVMVVGYPGRTSRYRLASEAANTFEWTYPTLRVSMTETLAIIEEMGETYPDVKIKYAATVAGINNASKNFQGMIDGYAGSTMVARKQALEAELQKWITSDPQRKAQHASTLTQLRELIEKSQSTQQRDMILGQIGRSALFGTARRLYRLSRERERPDADREPGYQERDMLPFKQRLERMDRRFHPEVDKALWRHNLNSYLELSSDQRVESLEKFLGLDDLSKLDGRLDEIYSATQLGDKDVRLKWMEADRAAFEAADDPFIQLAVAIYDWDREREETREAEAGEFQAARSSFMKTMIAFTSSRGTVAYPDANSSLRVTYGNVRGYRPRDGVFYTPFTSLEGLAAKHTGEEPFDATQAQLDLIAAGDHGSFGMKSINSVPVNFLSTVDTTGGNSGSPTLNSRGELVGLLFDGTYDSINADWDFGESTRSIHVDIRYILWVMNKVDHAERVLDELGF